MPARLLPLLLSVLVLATTALAPAKLEAQCVGDDCEVLPPPSSAAATESTLSSTELLWPAAPPTLTGVVEQPYLRRGRDMGLLGVGIFLLSAGAGAGMILGATDQAARNCRSPNPRDFGAVSCDSWPWSFMPIAGPILAGTTAHGGSRASITAGVIAGPLMTAVQLVGLVILLFTVHGYTEDVAPSLSVAGLELQILPYASASEGGLSLSVAM